MLNVENFVLRLINRGGTRLISFLWSDIFTY